jgi:hypothetical protein
MQGHISTSLWDLTKILASASGTGKWSTKDRETLLEHGKAGLKLLQIKYGEPSRTSDES